MYNVFYICASIIPILLTCESQTLYLYRPNNKFFIIKNIFNCLMISLLVAFNINNKLYPETLIPSVCILYHFLLTILNYKNFSQRNIATRITFENMGNVMYDLDNDFDNDMDNEMYNGTYDEMHNINDLNDLFPSNI